MRTWRIFHSMIGNHWLWMSLLVLLGLLLLMVGLVAWRRAMRAGKRISIGAGTTLLGTLVTALGGYIIYLHPQPFLNLFQRDFRDPWLMAELANADLRTPASPARPGDWPQWRGPNRDGKSAETGLLEQWPDSGPPVEWRVPIKGGYASMAIVNGRLFTMDRDHARERVLCFDVNDKGKLLWEYGYAADYGSVQYPAGPRATPTVHDGRVYTLGASGIMHCLEAEPPDGKPRVFWSKDLNAEFAANSPAWGHACSPLIEGDLVIVQPGGGRGSVVALHRLTGKKQWAALSDGSGYCSPIAMTVDNVRLIITMTGSNIVGLRASDGEELFKIGWQPNHYANIATPIQAGNYVFLSSNYGHGCTLVKLSGDGDGGIQAEQVYRERVMQNHHATSVLVDDHLYGFHGNQPAILICVNIRTAEEVWKSRATTKGTLIWAQGMLIIFTENGELALLEATPESGSRVRGRVQLFDDGNTWALPVLSNGRLYVRGGKELVCFDLRKK
jgi:outer membrane protein assembly factor BamB